MKKSWTFVPDEVLHAVIFHYNLPDGRYSGLMCKRTGNLTVTQVREGPPLDDIPVMGSADLGETVAEDRRASLRRRREGGTLPPRPRDTHELYYYWDGERWRAHPK